MQAIARGEKPNSRAAGPRARRLIIEAQGGWRITERHGALFARARLTATRPRMDAYEAWMRPPIFARDQGANPTFL